MRWPWTKPLVPAPPVVAGRPLDDDGEIMPQEGWAHLGCPKCGQVNQVPEDRLDESWVCPHNGRMIVAENMAEHWGHGVLVKVERLTTG